MVIVAVIALAIVILPLVVVPSETMIGKKLMTKKLLIGSVAGAPSGVAAMALLRLGDAEQGLGILLRQPPSISRSAAATSTQRDQPLSAKAWASAAVMGVSDVSATDSPKARSARSQRSVCAL